MKKNFSFRYEKNYKAKLESLIKEHGSEPDFYQSLEILGQVFGDMIFQTFPIETNLPLTIYRVTEHRQDIDLKNFKSFSCPPKDISATSEKGRAHLPGFPVFYGSTNEATALREMKAKLFVEKSVFLSEWIIQFDTKVDVHQVCPNLDKQNLHPLLHTYNEIFEKSMGNSISSNVHIKRVLQSQNKLLGDMFTEVDARFYSFTAAYAHNILYRLREQNFNVSILFYPSAVSEIGMINCAIHPDLIDSGAMKLSRVTEIKVTEITNLKIQTHTLRKGIKTNNIIEWDN